MTDKPRFYLDENVPVAVAEQLQRREIEVTTARDLDLLGEQDVNHLAKATEMGYVLCTYDADFLRLVDEGIEHAGIVFGQGEKHFVGEWVNGLERIHAAFTAGEMKNCIEFL